LYFSVGEGGREKKNKVYSVDVIFLVFSSRFDFCREYSELNLLFFIFRVYSTNAPIASYGLRLPIILVVQRSRTIKCQGPFLHIYMSPFYSSLHPSLTRDSLSLTCAARAKLCLKKICYIPWLGLPFFAHRHAYQAHLLLYATIPRVSRPWAEDFY